VLARLAVQLADDDGAVRQAAADALAQCGDDALPALASILQTPHEGARTRAAYALRKIASRQAAPILFRLLNDANYMVHTYAYEALDEMGLLENLLVM
jgi:HEAT repeat protein